MEFDPFWPECLKNPYPFFKWMRENEPVYTARRLGIPIITRYEDVERALHDYGLYSSAGVTDLMQGPYNPAPENFIGSDPPYHSVIRRVVSKSLTPRTIASMRHGLEEIVSRVIQSALEKGRSFDIARDVCLMIPLMATMNLLGIDLSYYDRLSIWVNAMLEGINVAVSGEQVTPERDTELRRDLNDFRGFLVEMLDLRRRKPRDDLTSALVRGAGESGNALSLAEQVSTLFTVVGGGFESTSKFLGTILLTLLEHPDQLALVRNDPNLITSAVREGLRYDGPAVFMIRRLTRDDEVAGVHLPGGSLCLVSFASANHDERKFPTNAEAFDINRRQTSGISHLAFGSGVHRCVGANLASLQAEVFLEEILRRFAEIEWEPDKVERGNSFFVRGVTKFPVTVRAA
jgi:hypothetical protein